MTEYIQVSDEIHSKALFVYSFLRQVAEGPQDAMQILISVYCNLWRECKAEGAELEVLLASFCETIRLNADMCDRDLN